MGQFGELKWQFGDSTLFGNTRVYRIYHVPGTYPVSLTVTDNDGASTTISKEIIVQPDWNPWDDDEIMMTSELQEVVNHWLNDLPKNDHLITTAELQEMINLWLTT